MVKLEREQHNEKDQDEDTQWVADVRLEKACFSQSQHISSTKIEHKQTKEFLSTAKSLDLRRTALQSKQLFERTNAAKELARHGEAGALLQDLFQAAEDIASATGWRGKMDALWRPIAYRTSLACEYQRCSMALRVLAELAAYASGRCGGPVISSDDREVLKRQLNSRWKNLANQSRDVFFKTNHPNQALWDATQKCIELSSDSILRETVRDEYLRRGVPCETGHLPKEYS